jgi:hypothetical protein
VVQGSQHITIKDGRAFDGESSTPLDLDNPTNSEIKDAMATRSWEDGTYRLDKASRTLVQDVGGGARS